VAPATVPPAAAGGPALLAISAPGGPELAPLGVAGTGLAHTDLTLEEITYVGRAYPRLTDNLVRLDLPYGEAEATTGHAAIEDVLAATPISAGAVDLHGCDLGPRDLLLERTPAFVGGGFREVPFPAPEALADDGSPRLALPGHPLPADVRDTAGVSPNTDDTVSLLLPAVARASEPAAPLVEAIRQAEPLTPTSLVWTGLLPSAATTCADDQAVEPTGQPEGPSTAPDLIIAPEPAAAPAPTTAIGAPLPAVRRPPLGVPSLVGRTAGREGADERPAAGGAARCAVPSLWFPPPAWWFEAPAPAGRRAAARHRPDDPNAPTKPLRLVPARPQP
jgi:hypothetical protein